MTSFYTEGELYDLGITGKGIQISRNAKIYGKLTIGDYSRIDDFCVLSASEIEIGRYVHIAAFCTLQGSAKITLCDFSGLSSRVSIYSSSGDYSGKHLANPNVPEPYSESGEVKLGRHALVGCGSVIMPGVIMYDGSAVGALSFVKHDCDNYWIYAGNPAVKIKPREKNLLHLEL